MFALDIFLKTLFAKLVYCEIFIWLLYYISNENIFVSFPKILLKSVQFNML